MVIEVGHAYHQGPGSSLNPGEVERKLHPILVWSALSAAPAAAAALSEMV